jgi:N-acetylneuraminic acid mutarotase
LKKLKLRLKVANACAYMLLGLLVLSLSQLKLAYAMDMPSPSWRTKTGMTTARGQVAVAAGDDGLIYAMGGWAGVAELSTVEAYSPLTNTWTTKAAMPEATRGAAVAKGLDGIIYMISGFNGSPTFTNTVQAYNTTSNTWSTKAPIPTAVWIAGAATGNDGKIYVIGGEPQTFPSPMFTNKTQIYDPSTDTWTNGTDMSTARKGLGVVKGPDGLIYAMGGYNGSALSVVEAYDPSTDTWIEKAPMPSLKVEFGLVLGPDEKIYVIGGGITHVNNSPPFFDTIEIYDPKTDTWTIPGWSESTMPTARKELGAALGDNGRIYVIGGANGAYINTNEEASIVLPENSPPTAYIDSITPNPATREQTISFVGHGTDPDGSVTAYKWRSSIDGAISTSATFSLSTLTDGMHTIYFSVKDSSGAWSEEATAIVTVNKPITEDPIYQELVGLNETLSDRINGLSQQNANLTDKVNSLTQKIDLMTLELLGASVVIIVLVFVAIAVTYISKRQPSSA